MQLAAFFLWRDRLKESGLIGRIAPIDGLYFELEGEVTGAQAGVPVPLKTGRRLFLGNHGGARQFLLN
jgi:hypothetical protein